MPPVPAQPLAASPPEAPHLSSRMNFIDALKALASQAIVLHHLAFYGPMSDFVAAGLAPGLMAWLSQDARIAVQIFLVIGGFLAAKSLAPAGVLLTEAPLHTLRRRYQKLVLPYMAAILLAIVCASLARLWMTHDSIPGVPSMIQLLAHTLLLQSVLGYDSLSAGVWYVAIDFQLFALLLALLWLGRRLGFKSTGPASTSTPTFGLALVAAIAAASLFYFNRDSNWDNWALYFFGAYGLGALTWWASARKEALLWLMLLAALVTAALVVDYRSRIVFALMTALALGLSRFFGTLDTHPQSRVLAYLGRISYSVFLLNFPVALVVSAAFSRWGGQSPLTHAGGMLVAWGSTILAATLFHHYIECRGAKFLARASRPLVLLGERLALAVRGTPR